MKYTLFTTYILVILVANITAMQTINLPFGGLTTVGTLVFGVIFTLRDQLHDYGRKTVYFAIALSSLCSLVYSIYTQSPVQIIIASVLGLAIGEITDTEAFEKIKNNNWLFKVLASNAISVPVDTFLFNIIAFVGTELSSEIWTLSITDIFIKYSIATIVGVTIFFTRKYKTETSQI